ncbi:hypothetical protein ACF0H5_010894 [Mactra antiquata]
MADDALENEDDWSPIRFREDEEMDFFTELALHEAERWIQGEVKEGLVSQFKFQKWFKTQVGVRVGFTLNEKFELCLLISSLYQNAEIA